MKIKKDAIFYGFICLLLITGQVFGYDYSPYEADLDRIHNEELNQDSLISAADSVVAVATQNKQQAADTWAIKCALPMPMHELGERLNKWGRSYPDDWYFHTLGCNEDTLIAICNSFVAKSKQELEQLVKSRHQPTRDFANIVLQNILVRESYDTCEKMRNIAKQAQQQAEQDITNANTDKQTAQQNKQKLTQEFTKKQQELEQIKKQQEDLRIEQEKMERENKIKTDQENKDKEEQEKIEREKLVQNNSPANEGDILQNTVII
jgi:hypothetical protein